jgi:hypothetical protein
MADRLEDLLRGCTVRVTGGPMSGAGFFVAPGKVLTCVHVIKDCDDLRVIEDSADPVVRWERDRQPALEAKWCRPIAVLADKGRPIPALKCPYPDIAVLQIDGLDGHPCVRIDPEWPSQEDSLLVFGYPEEGGAVQLTPARLTYRGPHGTSPTVYLDLGSDTIKPGMSGAAVLNLRSGAVCGVVVASKHPAHPDGALAIPWSAIAADLEAVLAANEAFHDMDNRWKEATVSREAAEKAKLQRRLDKLRPELSATTEWKSIRVVHVGGPFSKLYATVRNLKNRDYDVNGTCRSSDSSAPGKQISFRLPAYGKSEEIYMGSKGPKSFTPVEPLYDSLFLELKTADGIGDWKRAFKVTTHPRNRGYGPQDMEPI